ncbi:hypothetical protein BX666DRAFT_1854086, partial [Dichotomocladium elegans]
YESIRGKGFRGLLRKHGFEAFLIIDEHNTSRHCATCLNQTLSTYKQMRNLRPARRGREETCCSDVICHGLLR